MIEPHILVRLHRSAGIHMNSRLLGYHNSFHVAHMLEAYRGLWGAPHDVLDLAIRWHDAIYIPGFPHNEEASARALRSEATQAGLGANDEVDGACALIKYTTMAVHLSTKEKVLEHEQWAADTYDIQVRYPLCRLLDCDLSAMAEPNWDLFMANQVNIASEHLGPKALHQDNRLNWIMATAEFFCKLLSARTEIYHTPEARRKWEEPARRNLRVFIEWARAQPTGAAP